MGFLNTVKEQSALDQARHAIEAGRTILVFKFMEAHTNSLATGAMTGINDQMEAIESLGWRLDKMSVCEGNVIGALGSKHAERVVIVCLYRRTP
ncbi:hypothetical protein SLUN_11775 [Streptomyces lunaelactis]|uniref:Uncharacterized protein n=1 Tax=Streptomyces lunaelactis TaxID=1535768 RepID=A0A2R4T0V0_9ACTN|nr:hypothetical protein [Streptomyces lunaelactis]AVZ72765.1 hypothetical protein SLUN_11775 [Streptomyces lunaelactis]NUK87888.1 hypothetical protein [Streptomyces lunaelactis]